MTMIVNSTISYKSPQGYRPDLRSLNNAAPLALRLLKRYRTEKHGHQQIPPWPIDTAESPEVVKTPPATRDPGEHRGIDTGCVLTRAVALPPVHMIMVVFMNRKL